MRNLLKLVAMAMLAMVLAPAAQAQGEADYTFAQREIGDWKVYGYNDKCWMIRLEPVDGTILAFSFASRNGNLYISGENRSWTSLVSMQRYDSQVEFGSARFAVPAIALQQERLGPMIGIFVTPERLDFFKVMPAAQRISVTIEGEAGFEIPLANSGPALAYFEQCARTMKVGPFRP